VVTAPSGLNSGVRYVMPMFVLLSILAAGGVTTLWGRPEHRHVWRTAAIALMVWLVASSALAHPDYLAYFNELGGKDPSRILVISDFDWGQDMTRLAAYLREHDVKHVAIAYDGFYVPESLGLPETDIMPWCGGTASGWVVIQARRALLHPECFQWIAQQKPVAVVGKTMRVYYIPPN